MAEFFYFSNDIILGLTCSIKVSIVKGIYIRLLLSITFISFLLTFNVFVFHRTSIKEDANQVTPLLNGMQVPNITVKTADGDPLSVLALLIQNQALLVFYRGGCDLTVLDN